jgi:hypothetical protein
LHEIKPAVARNWESGKQIETGSLLMTVGDPAFGQVVWRELHGYTIACEDSDSIATEFASEVGENGAVSIELDAK